MVLLFRFYNNNNIIIITWRVIASRLYNIIIIVYNLSGLSRVRSTRDARLPCATVFALDAPRVPGDLVTTIYIIY